MILVRLIYASRLQKDCTVGDLNAILDASRKNNPRLGISGILCYTTEFFLQWLEGPRGEVNTLYNLVVQDPRHRGCVILDYTEVQTRQFESWGMAFISAKGIDRKIWSRYMHGEKMDPYELTHENASVFLVEAAKAQKDTWGGKIKAD